jgi:hypothetical protein
MIKNTLLVNIFGGPAIGKSDCARELTNLLSRSGFSCEYVSEFAKPLVWGQNFKALSNQVFVTASQFNDLLNVYGQVDFLITDSPVLTGIAFPGPCCTPAWETHVLELHHHFNHVNFVLERNIEHYKPEGRVQNLDGCLAADILLETFLHQHGIKFDRLLPGSSPAQSAFDLLMKKA